MVTGYGKAELPWDAQAGGPSSALPYAVALGIPIYNIMLEGFIAV